MNLEETLFPVLFLGLFQVIGGTALGSGLRMVFRDRQPVGSFFIIWGSGFGGIPVCISVMLMLEGQTYQLALVGPALFFGSALFAFALLQPMIAAYGFATTFTIALGAVLMLAGAVVGAILFNREQISMALALGGVFGLAGGVLIALGVGAIMRGQS